MKKSICRALLLTGVPLSSYDALSVAILLRGRRPNIIACNFANCNFANSEACLHVL